MPKVYFSLTFGWIGKQHHRTKAINATIVPIKSMKSSIVCENNIKMLNDSILFAMRSNFLPAPLQVKTFQMV